MNRKMKTEQIDVDKLREIYQFMAENKNEVDSIIKLIFNSTLDGQDKKLCNLNDILCSIGVQGLSPGVDEGEKGWRHYTTKELEAMRFGDKQILAEYVKKAGYSESIDDVSEETLAEIGKRLAIVVQLEAYGVLRWHFQSTQDERHHYSMHKDLAYSLLALTKETAAMAIIRMNPETNKVSILHTEVRTTELSVNGESSEDSLKIYDRLASNVGNRNPEDVDLTKIDKIVSMLYQKRKQGLNLSTTLRGQPFIGENNVYDNPNDGAFGDQIDRACGLCFYRSSPKDGGDCDIITDPNPTPHQLFGCEGKFLPKQIDGKEVGHYCKYFADFRIE